MKKLIFLYISIFFICLFLCPGCGLETYYVVEGPTQRYTNPTVTSSGESSEYLESYFSFETNDEANYDPGSAFKYMGTAVYYKIYNDYSAMNAHISAVSTLSSSTNYSSAFPKLQSYGYQELGVDREKLSDKTESYSPLIKAADTNRKIVIRLTNYKEPSDAEELKKWEYRAKILIDADGTGEKELYPMRQDNTKSFDFGRKNSNGDYDKPKSGEDDVNYGTASKEDIYYVTLYAVAVGHDNTFTNYYSNVLYLGSVAINAAEEDN